jgi:hypothetical protein
LAPQRQDGSETILTSNKSTVYPLRNGSDIMIPFCILSNTYDSFIPSTIRHWNSLDPLIRNVDSIAKLTAELRKRKDISQVRRNDRSLRDWHHNKTGLRLDLLGTNLFFKKETKHRSWVKIIISFRGSIS